MKPPIEVGNSAELRIRVTDDMCPVFEGAVLHRVCATWSLAHQMEVAARRVLAPHLEPDEEGIGTHVSVDHVAPAPVGCELRVHAEVVEMDDTTLVCRVDAWNGSRLVGRGRQVQRILPRARIEARLAEADDAGGHVP